MGAHTTAYSCYETVIGYSNTAYTPVSKTAWDASDRLFVIANGYYGNSNAITVLKNGCIGLQTVTSPSYALELPNNLNVGIGRARAYAWDTYSDARIKSNRQPLPYGIAEVMQLNPQVYFQHNSTIESDGIKIEGIGSIEIGLVAQEVYKIIPEAVSKPENEEKDLWSMSYEKLIPILVKAIQQQQEMIQKLQNTAEAKQTEIDKLNASLAEVNKLRSEFEQLKSFMHSTVSK